MYWLVKCTPESRREVLILVQGETIGEADTKARNIRQEHYPFRDAKLEKLSIRSLPQYQPEKLNMTPVMEGWRVEHIQDQVTEAMGRLHSPYWTLQNFGPMGKGKNMGQKSFDGMRLIFYTLELDRDWTFWELQRTGLRVRSLSNTIQAKKKGWLYRECLLEIPAEVILFP